VELLITPTGNMRGKSGAQLGSLLRLLRLPVCQNPMSRGFKKWRVVWYEWIRRPCSVGGR